MIFEDERAAPAEQLGFVLHLGDFIYEVVEYPDEVKTRYDRTIYEVARIPDGGKVGNFHFPLTVDGYRAVYKGYLADPDLQDARARWPFVAIWDNHEFSWQGWQSIQKAGGVRAARARHQGRRQPGMVRISARARRRRRADRSTRSARPVKDVPIEQVGRERPRDRTQQSEGDQQPDRLPDASATAGTSI
jgi:alkaline phosphatase D